MSTVLLKKLRKCSCALSGLCLLSVISMSPPLSWALVRGQAGLTGAQIFWVTISARGPPWPTWQNTGRQMFDWPLVYATVGMPTGFPVALWGSQRSGESKRKRWRSDEMPFDPDVNWIRLSIYHEKRGKRSCIYRLMVNWDEIWACP